MDSKKKTKRIGIDMRMMKPFPTGIGSHFINLIHELIRLYPDYEYILIINERGGKYVQKYFRDVDVQYANININGGSFKQYALNLLLIKAVKKLALDVLITDPWSSFVGIPCPYILMIYDLIGFHHIVKLSKKQLFYDRFLYKYQARHACRIIASTKTGRDDIMHFLHIPEKKIAVVMPSVASEYTRNVSKEYIQTVLSKYHLSGRYIVYIGNRRPHKNILGSLAIMNILKADRKYMDVSFVLIGTFDNQTHKPQDELAYILNKNYPHLVGSVSELGRIEENREVKAILSQSICLLHPTVFEGIGLTPLEAMYSQTPVVTSTIPAVEEVVGDSGILLDPKNTHSYAKALSALLDNETLRQEYIKKGFERACSITWERAAKDMHEAIDTCLK